ncbi:MAG: alpha/beta hydrolase [Clostridium sp.]|nr:alpha/beta hydrolase [Clostridium sp.]
MGPGLYWTESGEGMPLILLHGNGEDSGYFVHQTEYFSKQYRVIAIDTRGHGRSPRGETPFTIGQFAADLYDFMEEKGIAKAHILGFSDGGNIALAFALAHPKRVARLILNGANLSPGGVKASVQLPILWGYITASLLSNCTSSGKKKAEMLGLMVKEPHVKPGTLSGLHIKTLVIAGTRDMIKESHTRLIAASLPEGELVFIEGNHFIARKNPAAFNAAVEKFLACEES